MKTFLVNRLEVIDHTAGGRGREFVQWKEQDFRVELDFQDGGRTVKIFLEDVEKVERRQSLMERMLEVPTSSRQLA